MRRPVSLAVRRVLQTPRTFSNFPEVFGRLAAGRRGSSSTLTFRTRSGVVIECPNVAGARVPVYEIFAEDAYRFADLVEGLGADFDVLDIGAQVGCFSVGLAASHPGARVHAYEASPRSAEVAAGNVDRNGLGGRVEVLAVAVSDHSGEITFQDDGSGSALNGSDGIVGDTAAAGVIKTETLTVPCVTFRDAVAASGGRVDLVKIDTEGAEYAIVGGSSPEDWSGVRKVVIEYHPIPGHGWDELESFLTGAGFRVDRHESVAPGLGTVWLSRS